MSHDRYRPDSFDMASVPLLPVTASFISGLCLSLWIDSLWISLFFAFNSTALYFTKRKYLSICLASLTIGSLAIIANKPVDTSGYIGTNRFYLAKIETATENDNSQSAIVKIDRAGIDSSRLIKCEPFRAEITLPGFRPELHPGYTILFRTVFERVSIHRDIPDETVPEQLLLQRNITIHAIITTDDIRDYHPSTDFMSRMIHIRECLTGLIFQSNLNPDAKIFMATVLLGDSSGMSDDLRHSFSVTGISHILALSGLHVGLIAMFISIVLWPLGIFGRKKLVVLVTILVIWIYAALACFSPSVTRASIMLTIYLCGQMIQRRTSPLNSLCAAALIILLFDPYSIVSFGFQLSFAAVLSIILFSDILNPIPERFHFLRNAFSYISVCIAAMMGTALIAAIYFHLIPLYFLLTNIISALLLPPLIGCGLMLMIAELIGMNPALLCRIIDSIFFILRDTADSIAMLPHAAITDIYLPAWIAITYGVAIISLYLWLKCRHIGYGICFCLFLTLTIGVALFSPAPQRNANLYIARTTQSTMLIIDNCSDTLHILTTKPQEENAALSRAEKRYRDYMGRLNIDSIKIITTTGYAAPGFKYSHGNLTFGNKNIAILTDSIEFKKRHTDYALICRGYRGSIPDIVNGLRPDSIILSHDLHPRRAQRYEMECKQAGVPVINLRQRPWNLSIH